MERDVAMVSATPTEIGTDAEGAPHMAAMHACKRHRRARSANDGVGFGNGRRDAVKSEGKRSEEQRRCDENLLHESSSMIVTLIPVLGPLDGNVFSGRSVPKPKDQRRQFQKFKRLKNSLDVRFGSKADISECPSDVRFTPESRHGSARS